MKVLNNFKFKFKFKLKLNLNDCVMVFGTALRLVY